MPGRAGVAHDVALRRFDLDHLGAEVAQNLRRQRAQYYGGQVENFDAGERSWFGPSLLSSYQAIRVGKRRTALLRSGLIQSRDATNANIAHHHILLYLQQIYSTTTRIS
jgi:hypothetical protein